MDNDKEKYDSLIQYIMCFVGGFMGAYAILNHNDFLASAQTANLIHVVLCITGHNMPEFLMRIVAVLIYMTGLCIPVILRNKMEIDTKLVALCFEMLMVGILYFIDESVSTIYALYPVFFMTAIQWNSFPGAQGFVSSSIFSTNNFRQCTTSFTEYLCDKDRTHLKKTKFFGTVLLSYHAGVAVSYFAWRAFGMREVILCLVPLVIVFTILVVKNAVFGEKKHMPYNITGEFVYFKKSKVKNS